MGPLPELAGARATAVGSGNRDALAIPAPVVPDEDPGDAYAVQLRSELIGAMLEYSGSLLLDPDEWLTIAASGAAASITPREPAGGSITMLRIRGRDLAAFRARGHHPRGRDRARGDSGILIYNQFMRMADSGGLGRPAVDVVVLPGRCGGWRGRLRSDRGGDRGDRVHRRDHRVVRRRHSGRWEKQSRARHFLQTRQHPRPGDQLGSALGIVSAHRRERGRGSRRASAVRRSRRSASAASRPDRRPPRL